MMDSAEFWSRLWDEYDKEFMRRTRYGRDPEGLAKAEVLPIAKRRLQEHPGDIEILDRALHEPARGPLLAFLFRQMGWMPDELYEVMLDAALALPMERNFVEACVHHVGHRRVNESLLDMFENGTNGEKIAITIALYWAEVPLVFKGRTRNMDKAHATDESRAAFEALANLRSRRNVLFLQEFLDNPKVKLQEALIPHLVFDPAAYPDGMDHLVEAAIRKVRDSESSYIQHRGDIQITAPSDVSHVQVEFDTDST